jgi:hypothetical protein
MATYGHGRNHPGESQRDRATPLWNICPTTLPVVAGSHRHVHLIDAGIHVQDETVHAPAGLCGGQWTPSARAALFLNATVGARRNIVVLFCIVLRFHCGVGKLGTEFLRELLGEQPQLIGAQLFAARSVFGSEQLHQQPG